MRARTAILISGITLSMLISCTSSDGPGGPWQGTITEEDGIRTVSNPDVPLYGEISWELEAELVLGSDESDKNTLFHEARSLLVDPAGNIYVVDEGNFRIQKFDPQGQHLLTIGQEGQGPGEFEDLPAAFISPDETLYALGGNKLQRFKPDGTLLSSLPLTHRLVNFL
ncbi:MAG: 6-bladed beta-propeller, partial [Candidatus Aminicenantaceae bacterium]